MLKKKPTLLFYSLFHAMEHTQCTRCTKESTYCPLVYPWYCEEDVAWKKINGKRQLQLCCVCLFAKASYRAINPMRPCTCEQEYRAPKKKKRHTKQPWE